MIWSAMLGLLVFTPPAPVDTLIKKDVLAEGIYLFRAPSDLDMWTSSNVLVIVNDLDVTVFDTNTRPHVNRMVIAEIRKLTDKPVGTLINSHWHMDHWSGNDEYQKAWPGLRIIATAETRDFMRLSSHTPHGLEQPTVKGFVPTPPHVVDDMVEKLFGPRPPSAVDRVLDPGCGEGAFIEGIVRWCEIHHRPMPKVVGIESDPVHATQARKRFAHLPAVTILQEDFLADRAERFDYAIGNPPYVPITGLSLEEKSAYRALYLSAAGRFDLYLLFFEQSLRLLKPGARLVFITPEKFLYVQSAEALRKQLVDVQIEEIDFVSEATFGELVTYPVITTIVNEGPGAHTKIRLRDGERREVHLNGRSWLPVITGSEGNPSQFTLSDACLRISCGVATGADGIYVLKTSELPPGLGAFAYPTVAGREIEVGKGMSPSRSMLVPYAPNGALLPENKLGALGEYLRQPDRHERLLERTCVGNKPWYAFHETPPLPDILQPKILCKDISSRPYFLVDEAGTLVPRHSVYYIVPTDSSRVHEICDYLNSEVVISWLLANCQRAANGFVRLQSHVLKEIPVPAELVGTIQLEIAAVE